MNAYLLAMVTSASPRGVQVISESQLLAGGAKSKLQKCEPEDRG